MNRRARLQKIERRIGATAPRVIVTVEGEDSPEAARRKWAEAERTGAHLIEVIPASRVGEIDGIG